MTGAQAGKNAVENNNIVKNIANTGLDFVPIVGTIKSFKEAETAIDYLAVAISLVPGAGPFVGKAVKAAQAALKMAMWSKHPG